MDRWTALTSAQVEEKYNLSEGAVRQYMKRHRETMRANGEAFKIAKCWFVSVEAAARIWGHRVISKGH